ncbi:hypothetical protein T484DRAFT_1968306 [Baffinella frigidus]|nr:hypothetical protein T484DRAFT_1968306 [Cryptophyta sp. CCMP2293]
MGMFTNTQGAPGRDWLPVSLGSQVRNTFHSFLTRASNIKTASNNTGASEPLPSAPSSCATLRDQLTTDNTRRLPPRTTQATADNSSNIPVKEAISAMRRAVSYANHLQSLQPPQDEIRQGSSWHTSPSFRIAPSPGIRQGSSGRTSPSFRIAPSPTVARSRPQDEIRQGSSWRTSPSFRIAPSTTAARSRRRSLPLIGHGRVALGHPVQIAAQTGERVTAQRRADPTCEQ